MINLDVHNEEPHRASGSTDRGFSLIEVLISMAILVTGLLSLAGVFVLGLNQLSNSSAAMTAREKAREAVESVHTARDTRVIRWCQIYNVGAPRNPGCATEPAAVFVVGMQPLRNAGPDGLVNTSDDFGVETMIGPGPDNILGTADDAETELTSYRREIEITEIMTNGLLNPDLRQVRVRVRYGRMVRNGQGVLEPERTYELVTYVSSIS